MNGWSSETTFAVTVFAVVHDTAVGAGAGLGAAPAELKLPKAVKKNAAREIRRTGKNLRGIRSPSSDRTWYPDAGLMNCFGGVRDAKAASVGFVYDGFANIFLFSELEAACLSL
jgi:hypothetical protein